MFEGRLGNFDDIWDPEPVFFSFRWNQGDERGDSQLYCQVANRKVVGKKEFAKGCEAIGFEGGMGCRDSGHHLTLGCFGQLMCCWTSNTPRVLVGILMYDASNLYDSKFEHSIPHIFPYYHDCFKVESLHFPHILHDNYNHSSTVQPPILFILRVLDFSWST